jgi:hypothetical protein
MALAGTLQALSEQGCSGLTGRFGNIVLFFAHCTDHAKFEVRRAPGTANHIKRSLARRIDVQGRIRRFASTRQPVAEFSRVVQLQEVAIAENLFIAEDDSEGDHSEQGSRATLRRAASPSRGFTR